MIEIINVQKWWDPMYFKVHMMWLVLWNIQGNLRECCKHWKLLGEQYEYLETVSIFLQYRRSFILMCLYYVQTNDILH